MKHVLTQIESVFTVLKDAQQVIEDTLLPTGNEHVERLPHLPPASTIESRSAHPQPPERSILVSLVTDADCGKKV